MNDITEKLIKQIQNKGYETASGRICFPSYLKEKYRKETGNYTDDNTLINAKMLDIYNNAN